MVCEELSKFTNVDIEYLRKESKEKISPGEKDAEYKRVGWQTTFFSNKFNFYTKLKLIANIYLSFCEFK